MSRTAFGIRHDVTPRDPGVPHPWDCPPCAQPSTCVICDVKATVGTTVFYPYVECSHCTWTIGTLTGMRIRSSWCSDCERAPMRRVHLSCVDHSKHGRGDADGPDDEACGCTYQNPFESSCAMHGCGFCLAAIQMRLRPKDDGIDPRGTPPMPNAGDF